MHATASTHPKTPALWPLFVTISAGFRGPLLMALLAMIASLLCAAIHRAHNYSLDARSVDG